MADIDISNMPDPGTLNLQDSNADLVGGMPSPDDLFQKRAGRAPDSPAESARFMHNPSMTAEEIENAREQPVTAGLIGKGILKGVERFGEGVAGAAHGIISSIVPGVEFAGRSAGEALARSMGANPATIDEAHERSREKYDAITKDEADRFWSYMPGTPTDVQHAKQISQSVGDIATATSAPIIPVAQAATATIPDENLRTTLQEAGGDINRVASALPALGIRGGARALAERVQGEPKPTAATPPPGAPPGPTAADDLRSEPNPIPPPNEAPAPQKPHLKPRAGESAQDAAMRQAAEAAQTPPAAPATPAEPKARTFAPPSEEGPQPTPNPADQPRRQKSLTDLNELSGGKMPQQRDSAVSGDYAETGNDWQHARLNDQGGKAMQGQIASENDALQTAAQRVHQGTGSAARNSVDTDTLEARAGTVRGALSGIRDWFDTATTGMYNEARRTVGNNTIPELSRVKAFLDDDSNFSNTNSIALQKAAKTRLERLWTTGDPSKNAPPGSVSAAERFREFLNEQWHPDSNGVIKKLKDSTDADVAEHGGPGMFEAARNLRTHSAQLLEHPKGVEAALDTADRAGSWKIPDHKLMDHIVNLPRDQFEHFTNALKAGGHLGDGRLADSANAALREIRAHMVSRIHEAARNSDGTWNAREFYNKANQYSTKMPSIMSPETIKHLQTLNDAGNTLRMDKSYPGAAAQTANTGLLTRGAKFGGELLASTAHEIPVVGRYVGKGIEHGVERATEKSTEARRAREVQSRLSQIGGGKQRGSVQVMRENNASGESEASLEAINRAQQEKDAGQSRHLIDAEGNATPLMGVGSVDRRAPAGNIIVQRGIGAEPYTVLDRGGMSQREANGLLARSQGLGKLAESERTLEASRLPGKQRGSARVLNQSQPSEESYLRTMGGNPRPDIPPIESAIRTGIPQAPRGPTPPKSRFKRQAG